MIYLRVKNKYKREKVYEVENYRCEMLSTTYDMLSRCTVVFKTEKFNQRNVQKLERVQTT